MKAVLIEHGTSLRFLRKLSGKHILECTGTWAQRGVELIQDIASYCGCLLGGTFGGPPPTGSCAQSNEELTASLANMRPHHAQSSRNTTSVPRTQGPADLSE